MISVIVVTYNRKELLKKCLKSLLAQNSDQPFEIIIVDNGSDDGTESCIHQLFGQRVHYIRYSERQNISRCKETGIEAAAGEAIAFIDDDCLASSGWIAAIASELAKCDVVGGPVLPATGTVLPSWWQDSLYWLIGINTDPGAAFFPLGSNVAFRKNVLFAVQREEKISGNNKCYYPPYAEDNYRLKKALSLGFSMNIASTMSVLHYVPEDRLMMRYLLRRSLEEGHALAIWEHSVKRLIRAFVMLFIDPLRMLLTFDFNRFFRFFVNASYIIHYLKG
jgi:glycosyltransferase involved in cell wall biosynthesis